MKVRKFTPGTVVLYLLLFAASASTLFPFYFLLVSAFKKGGEYFTNYLGIPLSPTLSNFVNLFTQFPTLRMAFNSLLITSVAVIALTVIVAMASFIFTKFPYPGSQLIELGIIAAMMVPMVVLIIPVYLTFSWLKLINSYLSPIIFYTSVCIPFSLYLCTAGFKGIPDECVEAAMIDGASLSQIFTRVIVPMGKPSIITMITLNFLWCWNEFLYSMLLLQKPNLRALTVGVALTIGKRTTDMPLMLCGLLVSALPLLALFVVANKYLVKGMTAGAVKG